MSMILRSIIFTALLSLGVTAIRDSADSPECQNPAEDDVICDGQCVNKTMQCDGVYDCVNGEDEHFTICGCKHDEFLCPDGCIPIVERCDRNCTCVGCADEEHCEGFQCLPTHIKCGDHSCIQSILQCNFVDDCGDNSDEEDCRHHPCDQMFDFECANKQCISLDFVCDGIPDCLDGSDEIRCDGGNFQQCEDGRRVHESRWCNYIADCHSGSDEFNCERDNLTRSQCPADANGRCFMHDIACNGFCECGDCVDEHDCDIHCDSTNGVYCPWHDMSRNEYRLSWCVRTEQLCDGIYGDCDSWQDEGCYYLMIVDDPLVPCDSVEDQRFILTSAVCDGNPDCFNGTDEWGCENVSSPCPHHQVDCGYGTCRDGARCNGYWDCSNFQDEEGCDKVECEDSTSFKCEGTGQCLEAHRRCNGVVDCIYVNGTKDHSDEDNCDRKACKADEFRCNNGHCIEGWRRCFKSGNDSLYGCPDHSHLENCANYDCASQHDDVFKCVRSYCIPGEGRCDEYKHCPGGTDEQDCVQECHPHRYPNCTCQGKKFQCDVALPERFSLDDMTHDVVTYLLLTNTGLNITDISLYSIYVAQRLILLDLSYNNFSELLEGMFVNMFSLRELNLGYNHIDRVKRDTFKGLYNLKKLVLAGNIIQYISNGSFHGLTSLTVLDLSHQRLAHIEPSTFYGLYHLTLLNISHNPLERMEAGIFYGLSNIHTIDMSDNLIHFAHENTFKGLPQLDRIIADEFQICCIAKHVRDCTPQPDEFSSCEDLMRNPFLRLNLWVVGLIATLCNAIVILSRSGKRRDSRVQSFLITNLAIGDMLMGVYLIIIAVADFNFRGRYVAYDKSWRESIICKFAGFLSTFSSELSVLSLTFITLHRVSSIVFPFRTKDVGFSRIVWMMTSAWVIVFILAAVPLLGFPYFGNFYGRSGVCLALHITPDKPDGWEYAVSIFLVLNFFSFTFIAGAYMVMFYVARRTQHAAKRSLRGKQGSDAMARKMTLIVFTDFLCWMPIIILGVASLCGARIHPQVFAWIAVFVLPLNSAVNPLLYTLWTTPYARRIITTISTHTFMRSMATSEYKLSANLSTSEKFSGTANGRRKGRSGFRGTSNSRHTPEKSNGSVRSCDVVHDQEEAIRLQEIVKTNRNVYVNPNNNDDRIASRTDGKDVYEKMLTEKGMEGGHSSGEE